MAVPVLSSRRGSSNEATASVSRKIAMLLDLLTHRCVRFSTYESAHGRDFRSFQRDVQQLRKSCGAAGYTIGKIRDREIVELIGRDGATAITHVDGQNALLTNVALALGEPILRQLGLGNVSSSKPDDFFQFVMPRLVEGSAVADVCGLLRTACESPTGRALVRFRYPRQGEPDGEERLVEPYHISARSGSFYLVGYDRGRKDWRLFSIDRFLSKPARAGTCPTNRTVPDAYASTDVIGFIKGTGSRTEVTVRLSPRVASTASSRLWQKDQIVEHGDDGSAKMTFAVHDVDEVVRWAFGFGTDAEIVAPPAAIARAWEIAGELASIYARAASNDSSGSGV